MSECNGAQGYQVPRASAKSLFTLVVCLSPPNSIQTTINSG